MFKKLFGGGPTPSKAVPAPLPKARNILLLPETEEEWAPIRAADILEGQSLLISAALLPRIDRDLQQARINRKPPSGDIMMEEMGCGVFTHKLSAQQLMKRETLDALNADAKAGEPFQVMLYAQYDGRSESDEGLIVFHVTCGGMGTLPSDDYSAFNSLFLNLELRTRLYACCQARIENAADEPVVHLDLARYEVCYNRCQRILHERSAGAQYQ